MAPPVVACSSPAISSLGRSISLSYHQLEHPLTAPFAHFCSLPLVLLYSRCFFFFSLFLHTMARKQNKKTASQSSDLPPGSAAGSNTGPGTRMSTRTSNKHAHPGRFDMAGFDPEDPDRVPEPPAQRREQAAVAREEAAAMKAKKKAVQTAGVDRAARLENEMQEDDDRADELRRRPPRPRGRYVPPAAKAVATSCMSTK